MKKKLHELTKEEYEAIYRSGFMGEFYPDASGCYEKDVAMATENIKRYKKERVKEDIDYYKSVFIHSFITTICIQIPGETLYRNVSLDREEFKVICDELEEERMNVIGQNGNDGLVYGFNPSVVIVDELDGFNLGTYQRAVKDTVIDIYDILELYKVFNPATAHAVKKLLMSGQRGYKGVVQDLEEAKQSITRAIELEKSYNDAN